MPPGTAALIGVLLAVPWVAILIVPIYSGRSPELAGWPFFYWYQVLWVPLSALFTGAAYLVLKRARGGAVR